MERAFFVLLIPVSEFKLLAIAPDSSRSIPFPRYIVFLIVLTLRRFIGADDFDTLIFNLEVFDALGGNFPPSKDLRRVSPPSKYIRFYRS